MNPAADNAFGQFVLAQSQQYLQIEAAGLFWLGAELAILFAVAEAYRAIQRTQEFSFTPGFKGRIAAYLVPFAIFSIFVLWAQYSLRTESLTVQWKLHITIWVFFILGWVILECLIVLKGLQAYQAIRIKTGRQRINDKGLIVGSSIFILMLIFLSVPLFQSVLKATPGENVSVISEAHSIDTFDAMTMQYENGKLLLLRMAGVLWISVEWVAAIVLFSAYYFLKRQAHA